eukprot:1178680-Amphidinium_carterae.1
MSFSTARSDRACLEISLYFPCLVQGALWGFGVGVQFMPPCKDQKIKIFGLPASQNVVSPVLLAMELKVGAFEFLDIMSGAHKQPEYLNKIPSGKVPGMEDGSVKIGESCAILRYLAM